MTDRSSPQQISSAQTATIDGKESHKSGHHARIPLNITGNRLEPPATRTNTRRGCRTFGADSTYTGSVVHHTPRLRAREAGRSAASSPGARQSNLLGDQLLRRVQCPVPHDKQQVPARLGSDDGFPARSSFSAECSAFLPDPVRSKTHSFSPICPRCRSPPSPPTHATPLPQI